jgi:hypothetical protein
MANNAQPLLPGASLESASSTMHGANDGGAGGGGGDVACRQALEVVRFMRTQNIVVVLVSIMLISLWSLLLLSNESAYTRVGLDKEYLGFTAMLVGYIASLLMLIVFRRNPLVLYIFTGIHVFLTAFMLGWFLAMQVKMIERG